MRRWANKQKEGSYRIFTLTRWIRVTNGPFNESLTQINGMLISLALAID
jgi:hypothetical protein